jgi:hypothetical protein
MSEANEGAYRLNLAPGSGDPNGGDLSVIPRLGHDLRFVLVGVGGGGVGVARMVARRRLKHLETVAINCDPRVQGFDEFDRRVYLGPDSGELVDTGGSPLVGGTLARAAEPALSTIFEGTQFVTIVASLGGGSGSGLVPYVLELASRYCHHVSAFLIKPFQCEGDRRALADRTIGRIHILELFNDGLSHGRARLQVLDNEALVGRFGDRGFSAVSTHWATVVGDHIEANYLRAAEAEIDALQTARAAAMAARAMPSLVGEAVAPPALIVPAEMPVPLPAAHAVEAELTFEVVGTAPPRPAS